MSIFGFWWASFGKNFNIRSFSNTKPNECQTVHDSSTYRASPIHTSFVDINILQSQLYQTAKTEICITE